MNLETKKLETNQNGPILGPINFLRWNTWLKLEKMTKNPQFGPFWVHFGPEKFLFENRASSLLYLLMANLMQKKSEKSNGGKYEI